MPILSDILVHTVVVEGYYALLGGDELCSIVTDLSIFSLHQALFTHHQKYVCTYPMELATPLASPLNAILLQKQMTCQRY